MTERNAITIIYLLQKKSRELPKVTLIQMTMHCSRSPLWRNTAGLCEVQSRIMLLIAENIIQIIFLILSRSQRTRESARKRSHLSKTHLTRNTYGMLQFVTNAGESQ